MRRYLSALFVSLALSLSVWAQSAQDLARQLPIDNPADPAAAMTQAEGILDQIIALGPDGIAQVAALIGTADDAKAWFTLNGLAERSRAVGEPQRLLVSNALLAAAVAQTDVAQRNNIIQILQYLGHDEVVPTIGGWLTDDGSNDFAARLLTALGTPAARAALQGALGQTQGRSQANIVRALGELREAGAQAPILALAGTDDPVLRESVLYALAEIGDPGSQDTLVTAAGVAGRREALANTQLLIRWAGRAGAAGEPVLQQLIADRGGEPTTTVDARLALYRLQGDAGAANLATAIATSDTTVRNGLIHGLEPNLSPALDAALLAWVPNVPGAAKVDILKALARSGGDGVASAIRAAFDDPDSTVRLGAIQAAALLDGDGVALLLDVVGRDSAADAQAAATALARRGDEAVVRDMVRAVRTAPDTVVASRLIGRLGWVGGAGAWRALGILLGDPPLADAAATALAAAVTKGPRPVLTEANRAAIAKAADVATDQALATRLRGLLEGGAGAGAGVNVALNADVFEGGDHEGGNVPEFAVDGAKDDPGFGWWADGAASLTVNLGEEQRISRTVLYTYWVGNRYYQYTVEVSLDNRNWSQVVDRSTNTTPSTPSGDEVTFEPVDAQFVRLNMLHNSANPSMHVVEFEVYGGSGSGATGNLAEGKPVTGTPEQEGTNAPEGAVDGLVDNPGVGWHAHGTPATLTVDLGVPERIDTTQTFFFYGDGRHYAWRVEVSQDGNEWTTVANREDNTIESRPEGFVDKFDAVEARWVRLVVVRNSANPYSHVTEFRVFAAGSGPAADPVPATPVVLDPPPPDADGFVSLLYDRDLVASGWIGSTNGYVVDEEMVMTCIRGQGGNLLTAKEYGNFHLIFDFRLTPGANNGLGIRTPASGNPAYAGMEIQILDDRHEMYENIQPWQAHGSIYGVVAARRDLLKPAGEWNTEEVIADGTKIKVIVNGEVAVDADLADITDENILNEHPGLKNASGHLGFLGHGDELSFRNIRIKEL